MEDFNKTLKTIEDLLKGVEEIPKGSFNIFYNLEDYKNRTNPRIFLEDADLEKHLWSEITWEQAYAIEERRTGKIVIRTKGYYFTFNFQGRWILEEFSDRSDGAGVMDWETVGASKIS